MAGIATIGHPDGSRAIVFASTSTSTLAMSLRDAKAIGGDEDETTDTVKATYQNSDVTIKGNIKSPTSLVSLFLRGNDTKMVCNLNLYSR